MSWISAEEALPEPLETVWISNGKGWTNLGCLIIIENEYFWGNNTGMVYQDNNKIVAECEIDDLDVKFWHKVPNAIIGDK
jgi:hypothetical protein